MTDLNINGLPEITSLADADIVEVFRDSDSKNKHITKANLQTAMISELEETNWTNGYDLQTAASIPVVTFNDGNRTVSVAVAGGSSNFYFWCNGTKITKTTTQTVVVPDTTGTYYIYFNNSGVLTAVEESVMPLSVIYENAITALVYWGKVAQAGRAGDELHGVRMSAATHGYNHLTIGARYDPNDGVMNIEGLVDGNDDYTQITSGHFWDEDIRHAVAQASTHSYLYRLGVGGEWTTVAADDKLAIKADGGDTYFAWNENTTGTTWQLTEGGASTDFFILYFAATPNVSGDQIVKIIGQNAFSSRNNARNAIESDLASMKLGGLPTPEMVFLYSAIVKRDGTLEELADGSTFFDLRTVKGSGGASSSTLYASDIPTDTTNFNGVLSATDVNVQIALETIDDIVETENDFTTVLKNKLDGIEALAEANNISDANATDLTDSGDSTLHYHATDRARANHTGTQTASTISDLTSTITGTKIDDLTAGDDNTDLNASTSAHGLLPKLGGGTTNFLRADGTWNAPAGGGEIIGADWTDQTISDTNWNGVAYGNGIYVAVAYNTSSATNLFGYSPDGVNWTNVDAPVADGWMDVAYGNGVFIAVASGSANGTSKVTRSVDGKTWTTITTPSMKGASVTFGDGVFVIGCTSTSSQRVVRSTDNGLTWVAATTPPNEAADRWGVCYGNGTFLTVANTGTNRVSYSTDGGDTWTMVSVGTSEAWMGACYGNGKFIIVANTGTNRIRYSSDGITWSTPSTPPTASNFKDVCYGNGYYIAVADSGTVVVKSADGETWTDATVSEKGWTSICFGNNQLVAVAQGATGSNGAMTSGSPLVANEEVYEEGVKSATLVTSVGTPGLDTNIPTEKAVRTAIEAGGGGGLTTYTTVTLAEAGTGSDNDLMWCVETETQYRYEASGSAYTDNNQTVLSTGDAGDTRWLGISGQYILGDIEANTVGIAELSTNPSSGTGLKIFSIAESEGADDRTLHHMDDGNGATTADDAFSGGVDLTCIGACNMSATDKYFGGTSLYVTTGYAYSAQSTEYTFTGAATIRFKFKHTTAAEGSAFGIYNGSDNRWQLLVSATGQVKIGVDGDGGTYTTATPVALNQWHEIAIVIEADDASNKYITIYVDGVYVYYRDIRGKFTETGTHAISVGNADPAWAGTSCRGYYDELLIQQGEQITGNYGVSQAPYACTSVFAKSSGGAVSLLGGSGNGTLNYDSRDLVSTCFQKDITISAGSTTVYPLDIAVRTGSFVRLSAFDVAGDIGGDTVTIEPTVDGTAITSNDLDITLQSGTTEGATQKIGGASGYTYAEDSKIGIKVTAGGSLTGTKNFIINLKTVEN